MTTYSFPLHRRISGSLLSMQVRFLAQRWSFAMISLVALLQRTPLLRLASGSGLTLPTSPAAQILRCGFATVATLGVIDTLVGATTYTQNPTGDITAAVGSSVSVVFTVTGSLTPTASFSVTGTLPPGVTIAGLASGVVNKAQPTISGTPTTAGSYSISVQAYDQINAKGNTDNVMHVINFLITDSTTTIPAFTAQPSSIALTVGQSLTLTGSASGSPAPTFQWKKDGTNIAGATNATLTIASVATSNAGNYTLVATNSAGSATSNIAVVTVTSSATPPPTFSTQPMSVSVATGQILVLFGEASGTPSPTFQWQKNGANIAGATSATYRVDSVDATSNGSYTLVATNSGGSVTSDPAVVSLASAASCEFLGLSVRAIAQPNQPVTPGIAIVGDTAMTVLIRAGGPGLAGLGVPSGTMKDPKVVLYHILPGGTPVKLTSNDNWDSSLVPVFARAYEYPWVVGSKDAALLVTLPPGNYSVEVSDTSNTAGEALIEVYKVK